MSEEPKELVSCGKCSTVNSVPFGLDVFKCYHCGVSVVISRETSSACAAASPTALYLNQLQAEGSSGSRSEPKAKSRGFFDRLTRQVDKTLQKVEQSLFDPPAEKLPVGQPVESKSPPPVASAGYPPPELKAAEERALRLEQLLEAATAREAVSSSERRQLRKQLDETEQLVSGLSQQLDSVQSEVALQRQQCEALEKALAEAKAPRGSKEELLKRIAELEAELQQRQAEPWLAPKPEVMAPMKAT